MSAATVSRLGQINEANDVLALFLKVFAGEVLTTFETKVVMRSLTRLRTIQSGKSASFPAIHKASVGYHTPGSEIVGKTIKHNEVIISIDDLLISDTFIANVDEAYNHYDVRAPYSMEMGRALARQWDSNVARNVIRAARAGELFTGDSDTAGTQITDSDADTSKTSLGDSILLARQNMDEKDVPVDGFEANAVLLPAQWYLLVKDTDRVVNKDVDGDGSFSKGHFDMIGGVRVHKTNNVPWQVDDSANSALPSDYRINMENTVAAVFTEAAAATVQLMGLAMEAEYDIRRQGSLAVGKYLVGHGPLLAKTAVEIKTS
jgi:hypothetical protein